MAKVEFKSPPTDPEVKRLIHKICIAKPPNTVRLVCPGCLWGQQVDDEKMYCAFFCKVRESATQRVEVMRSG